MVVLLPLIVLLLVVLIVVKRIVKRKRPAIIGNIAEHLVRREIANLPEEYIVFNDLLFESNGGSTQIDHLVVSPFGIFVIETKGYKGWILGGENSQYWTQTIYHSKHQFYNPIKQNEGHVRFLRNLLKCSADIPVIPIVVFNNGAKLKVLVENHIVVNRRNLMDAIKQYQTPILDKSVVEWFVETIKQKAAVVDKASMQRHIDTVARRKETTRSLIDQGICPLCGGQLVRRNGKYGSFRGCSNYPECKFTCGT